MFPYYRKYSNHQSFFVILSAEKWIEYKKIGKKFFKYEFTVQQFPERIFVQDLIQLTDGIEPCSSEEIEKLMQ